MKLKIAAVAVAGAFLATSAHSATIKVELWDVIAEYPSSCCDPNPTPEQQDAARTGGTNAMLGGPAYLANAASIIANYAADAVFYIDSTALAAGFHVAGMTGLGGAGDPTINDFFGMTIDGVGGNPMLGTILRLTGTVNVTSGQSYQVRSDDGYSIAIGDGSVVDMNDLQAPTTTTHFYDGSTDGLASFQMIWYETQRVDAALKVKDLDFVDVAPIPLPAAMPLLLGGLGALGVAGWRRRRKAA